MACSKSDRTTIDDEVAEVREVDGVVIQVEPIATGSNTGGLKITGISNRRGSGRGIMPATADDVDGVNGLTIGKQGIVIKISHSKGSLIKRESVAVNFFLLGRSNGDRAGLHKKVT